MTYGVSPSEVRLPETETETDNKTARSTKQTDPPEGFADWYQEYPRKTGKIAAAKSYGKAITLVDPDVLLDKTKAFARLCRDRKTEAQFIPNPATWLNQGRWDDEDLDGRPNRERKPWE